MKKTFLIISREYLSRVKKKSFLLVTFLVPLLFLAMIVGSALLGSQDSISRSHIKVIDESGIILNKLEESTSLHFEAATLPAEEAKTQLKENEDQHLLIIPADILESEQMQLLSSQKASLFVQDAIQDQVDNIIKQTRLTQAGIDIRTLESLEPNVRITSLEITSEGDEQEANAGIAMGIGLFSTLMIYLTLFIYGSQVMRGVIEEKNNRVVEIIISSVKPFQLMMGKIVGIGLVGLTQFLLWIILSGALMTVGGMIMANQMPDTFNAEQMSQMSSANPAQAEMQNNMMQNIQNSFDGVNFPYLIGCFLFYFLGGYLLYSALFAAVGSAVDNETESQQFMLPITMPLIFTYILAFSVLMKDPHGPIGFWLSMIPLTSPIAMMIRIPYGVPMWELALSMALLAGGFILTTWVAARIYRVGILMYGKKASYRELMKWFTYKK